jgi:hypothetical protein
MPPAILPASPASALSCTLRHFDQLSCLRSRYAPLTLCTGRFAVCFHLCPPKSETPSRLLANLISSKNRCSPLPSNSRVFVSSAPAPSLSDFYSLRLPLSICNGLRIYSLAHHPRGLRQSPGSYWNLRVQLDLVGSPATLAVPRRSSPHSLESSPLPHIRVLTGSPRLRSRCAHRI